MAKFKEFPYQRQEAVAYAHRWAYDFHPGYYNFSDVGGDCTNFASQCIYAGCKTMNFTETFGWYYLDINHRAPAWTGVKYLYNFLVGNQGAGPFAKEVDIQQVEPGDICQLQLEQPDFQHSPVIVETGTPLDLNHIWVAAHSYPVDHKILSAYPIRKVRFLHIEGFRKWT